MFLQNILRIFYCKLHICWGISFDKFTWTEPESWPAFHPDGWPNSVFSLNKKEIQCFLDTQKHTILVFQLHNPFVWKHEPNYISERSHFSFGLWNTYKLGLLTVIPKHKTKSKVTAYVFVPASPNYLQMYSNTIWGDTFFIENNRLQGVAKKAEVSQA